MFHTLPLPRRRTVAAACAACATTGLLAGWPSIARAEAQALAEPTPASGGTIVVSGQRGAAPAALPNTLTTVSAQQIDETLNTATTAGLLQYLPSVHVRERYIGDRNGVLVMRVNSSVASAQTTVYGDGLLLSNFLNNSFATAPRWGLVSPEEIDRVEVMYGPFSALYPGNSAGGVVQLLTRTPERFEAHVKLEGFTQRYREYGTDDQFSGGHASVSVGNRLGPFSYWLALDHLDNRSQPQTFGIATAKTGAAAAAGTFTVVDSSRVVRDLDTAGRDRLIVSSLGIDHTVQDMAKLKLGWSFGPALQISYTGGMWQNTSDTAVDSYLRTAAGATVYNAGAALANPFKFVRIDGQDHTLSAAAPSRAESDHWLHGLTLKGTAGALDWDLIASQYDQKKDTSRTATPTNGLDSSQGNPRPGGQLTDAKGTGWRNLDARGTWRVSPAHTLSLGAHHDSYRLASVSYGTSAAPITDWLVSAGGTLNTNSYGQTQTEALYLQDEWRVAPGWTLIAGGRQERWRAFGGSNYNAANVAPTAKNLVYADRSASHFSPKLQLAWQAAPATRLSLALGKAVRYPTVAEMFQTISLANNVRTNDPHLQAERVHSAEASVQQRWNGGQLRASYFFEDKRDALISQTDVTGAVTVSSIQNVDRVRTDGLELVGQQSNLGLPGLDVNASLTYAHSLILRDRRNPGLEGTVQPRIPDWRATVVATWRATERLSTSLAWRHSGRQHNALYDTTARRYNDVNPDVYGAVSRYSVVDAKLSWRVDARWGAQLGVNNLGNFRYYVNPNPYPQRTLFAGLRYDL